MRFTARADLPPSEFLEDYEEIRDACEDFSRASLIGVDTETDGLSFDGLGTNLLVVCLAHKTRRVAIPTYGEHARNLEPLAKMLVDTQDKHCNFNSIFDWNVLHANTVYKGRDPISLQTCWADGLKLFALFDEEGEDTYGQRGLKARSRHWIGLPMNNFDDILNKGKFLDALRDNPIKTRDYCTRDAWAHLGISVLGASLAKKMPWCSRCTECGEYCFEVDETRGSALCVEHGWLPIGERLTMWDWHVEIDIPFLQTLHRIQLRGLPIDWHYLQMQREPLILARDNARRAFLQAVTSALSEKAGGPVTLDVNPNSAPQLASLYHKDVDSEGNVVGLGYPIYDRTESGAPAMGKEALGRLWVKTDAPGIKDLLEYTKIAKILSTLDGLAAREFPRTGRVHTKLRPAARTGRLSSVDPNLQNVPARVLYVRVPPSAPYVPTKEELVSDLDVDPDEAEAMLDLPEFKETVVEVEMRRSFRAPDGYTLLCVDYNQLEVHLTAVDSRCDQLIRVILEGIDLHCYTAAKAFSAALRGAAYEDIYEAKQYSDGNALPRVATIRSLLTDLSRVSSVRGFSSEEADLLLADARPWIEQEETDAGLLSAMDQWCPESKEGLFRVLGTRDKELLNLRKSAKAALFGIIYGLGAMKLAVTVTEVTGAVCPVEDARDLIDSIKEQIFPGIGRMVRRQHRLVRERGYVRTAMGRYRHPAGAFSGDHSQVARAQRQASNSPIQGLASDVVTRAMIALEGDQVLKDLGMKMLLQIHDEILSIVPEENAEEALKRKIYLMENSHGLVTPVPLTVTGHAAKTWAEAK